MLKIKEAYKFLEELCVNAEHRIKVDEHYATIVECLRRLELVAVISLSEDTSPELTDKKLLNHISHVVFDDTSLLWTVEHEKDWKE